MKRTIITLSLLATVCGGSMAQTKDSIDVCQFVVAYDYKCHTQDRNGQAVVDSFKLAVQVGTHVTKCTGFYKTMLEDFHEWKNMDYQMGEWNARTYNIPTWYINHPDGEMQTLDVIVPNRYHVTGVAPKIDWQMSADTLTIGGYSCQKAVGKYAGRRWTVWFTEEVPTMAGPWKLRGLPGLIVKATDAEGIHEFLFCGLENRQTPIVFRPNSKSIKMDQKRFIKHRNKVFTNKQYVANPRYYIPDGALEAAGAIEMWAGGPEPAPEDKQTVIDRSMIVPKKVNVYQPLEQE